MDEKILHKLQYLSEKLEEVEIRYEKIENEKDEFNIILNNIIVFRQSLQN